MRSLNHLESMVFRWDYCIDVHFHAKVVALNTEFIGDCNEHIKNLIKMPEGYWNEVLQLKKELSAIQQMRL